MKLAGTITSRLLEKKMPSSIIPKELIDSVFGLVRELRFAINISNKQR